MNVVMGYDCWEMSQNTNLLAVFLEPTVFVKSILPVERVFLETLISIINHVVSKNT